MVVQRHRADEQLVTELIERWAAAIRAGDLPGVLADHADDIVMFDVPPPQDGVRGIDAYRDSWPPFFRWLADGAIFEIVDLQVTAGVDVAFAHVLLRCGSPEDLARRPDHRLRITLGLRKEAGRWVVAHEHHSFPLAEAPDGTASVREIRSLHERWFDRTAAADLDGLMRNIAADVVSYEHVTPLQYVGLAQVRQVCAAGLDAGPGEVTWQVPEMSVIANDDLAVAWGLNRVRVGGPDGQSAETWSRGTRVFRRVGDDWLMVHQHLSYPCDPQSGIARADLNP
ncbi:SgcJ/EcaC family oxidoreductase [Micromonospora sp. 15K316]|uniref:YybH family protein n=1 Tax=Micromonospora sp. 15K316 TaxID=2530376 RepID=UPI001044C665|nr:SgcJ/EcaC family oxidoreductase [Micromonospora sp. 15K316]TDC33132.1 SgcJ/EcaC family oxidoreductase [Micromonospora sp. 15K316]